MSELPLGSVEWQAMREEIHQDSWDSAMSMYLSRYQLLLDVVGDAELSGVEFDVFKGELLQWLR